MADNRKAVAYMRTSSGTNVGPDKDSEKRQRATIQAYARRAGITVVEWFYDPDVSGADPIEDRPGFVSLLNRIEGNGVRIVLIEDASRFARDLLTQELGIVELINLGVRVITASGDDLTDTNDLSRTMYRQIAGSFSQYEKNKLVGRLKAARDRKIAQGLKCGGRQSHAEARPDVVALAKAFSKQRTPILSLRQIAGELARQGYVNASGKAYAAASIKSMIEGR